MAGKFKVRSGALGSRKEMPKLDIDELGYRTDEKALYIGTESGNERLCGVGDAGNIDIGAINAEISQIKNDITSIIARLDALEKPSE